MSALNSIPSGISRLGRWCLAAAMAACLGLSGCCHMNLRGEGFHDDQWSNSCQQLRRPDNDIQFFGFSNKAREIEQDLGAR